VLTYQRLAEVCSQYLKKGSAVLVEGRLQMREWVTPQGGKRQRLEVRAEAVHFLERGSQRMNAAGETSASPAEGELF
jgi:single-strand DNA-binding protein